MERVVPQEVVCCGALAELWRQHHELLAEGKCRCMSVSARELSALHERMHRCSSLDPVSECGCQVVARLLVSSPLDPLGFITIAAVIRFHA